MTKKTCLKIINPIIGILMLTQMLSGIFGAKIPFEVFDIMHAKAGYVLAAGIILHVILNWHWIKTSYFKKAD